MSMNLCPADKFWKSSSSAMFVFYFSLNLLVYWASLLAGLVSRPITSADFE